jgi:hypothetical protein
MNSSRLAVISVLTCIGAWTAKSVAIGVAGGLDQSPLEGPLFLLGLLAFLLAVIALCVALTAGRPVGVRVLTVVGGVLAAAGFSYATNVLVTSVAPADPSWVWSEVNLWVGAILLLLLVTGRPRVVRAA